MAVVEAAEELQREGTTPTVAQAAERAGVSRATAYRYFPTHEALLVELADVTPAVASVEPLLASLTTADDAERRLLLLLDTFGPIMLADEENMRRALRVYLDTWLRSLRKGDDDPIVREGRRMRWLDKTLEPLDDLPEEQRLRLRAALALTLGIEPIVIMKDVCHLDDDETLAVLRWTATALLRAALEESSPA